MVLTFSDRLSIAAARERLRRPSPEWAEIALSAIKAQS